jgi:hypothetical protein
MTDRGSFSVQSEALTKAAAMWGTCADDVTGVRQDISSAVNMGRNFGVLAGSSGVRGNYNNWSLAMWEALNTARTNFTYLEAALTSTAADYDGVEQSVVTDFKTLDAMIGEGETYYV